MSGGALGAPGAAPAMAALPPVPREGLSLAALREFADKHAGKTHEVDQQPVPFEKLTTSQVCAALIKPATLTSGAGGTHCTYAELLLAQEVRDAAGYCACCTLRVSADAPRAHPRR